MKLFIRLVAVAATVVCGSQAHAQVTLPTHAWSVLGVKNDGALATAFTYPL